VLACFCSQLCHRTRDHIRPVLPSESR
jgi:hypothetical protein